MFYIEQLKQLNILNLHFPVIASISHFSENK